MSLRTKSLKNKNSNFGQITIVTKKFNANEINSNKYLKDFDKQVGEIKKSGNELLMLLNRYAVK